jgi:4-diphosphocytidyl-2-C-methyl-D-erythritol kinase
MILFPPSKINLGLHIIEKRPDGFHEIETFFFPIPLTDALEIIPVSTNTTFSQSGIDIPSDGKSNLCIQAYEVLKKDYQLTGVAIHLHKNIPIGAGLGGGSADAAYTLILLNEMFDLNISKDKLAQYASQLGSDCAFFIYNQPCYATGRGEILDPMPLSLKDYDLVLVKPRVHVSTVQAYGGVKPQRPEKSLKEIIHLPVNQWKGLLVNDFEKTVFKKFPEIEAIKNTFYEHGAIYASMSGSGASVFALFEKSDFDWKSIFPDNFIWQTRL